VVIEGSVDQGANGGGRARGRGGDQVNPEERLYLSTYMAHRAVEGFAEV
jgi:hypothetical protein